MKKMTPARFRQIRNLFEATIEQEPGARETFLKDACRGDEELRAEVVRLLQARGEEPAWLKQAPGGLPRTDPHSMEGRLIGPYQVLREIGHGGMGVVYLAARADHAFRKLVAIKIVHAGLVSADTIARFEQEREILASLDHPNIARLLDGGSTADGLSYLVLEYVEGRPIDVYCDEHRLDIPARLSLFRSVCAAVEYAHQKHVVHRDLKPSNILVTADGTAKLLDFGIAKLMPDPSRENTELITRSGLRLMTPEYASPEQVRGERVGAGTDVYALGVVLYELLTGHLPYRMRNRIFHEVIRVICEELPVRPSTAVSQGNEVETGTSRTTDQISRMRRSSPADLRRRLSGDLDGIVLKALEKDARDRYRSAAAFSNDVERHLEGRPVAARQASPGYRAGKFLQRNLPWAILVAALAAALISGGITIRPVGAAVIAGCLLAVGVWYAATNREIGRKVAQSEFLYNYIPPRVILFTLAFQTLQKPLAILYAVLSPMFCRQVIGWLGRRRSAGNLVLDLSDPIPASLQFLLAPLLVFVAWFQATKHMLPVYQALAYIAVWCVVFLHKRLEIRTRGIVFSGSLYPWEKIESYEWKVDRQRRGPGIIELGLSRVKIPTQSKDMLTLRLRRGIQFLPPVRIPIPGGRHDEVETIIARYLSEWPVNDLDNAPTSPTPRAGRNE